MDTNDDKRNDDKRSLTIPEKDGETISTSKYNFPDIYYRSKTQRELINKIYTKEHFDKDSNIVSLLKKKISSYRQQDRHKKILRKESSIITLDETIEKLVASKLKCHYCKSKVRILYKKVRDKHQWTLDRIDNSIGHNRENVVIACLECNLKRRTTEMDRFTFTKQLKITKLSKEQSNIEENPDHKTDSGEKQINKEDNTKNSNKETDKKSNIKIIKSEFL
tara:strand:+ start:597 stop:1259 length:663 start_codon:yes stop_codon:yes gene_type:complete